MDYSVYTISWSFKASWETFTPEEFEPRTESKVHDIYVINLLWNRGKLPSRKPHYFSHEEFATDSLSRGWFGLSGIGVGLVELN